MTQNEIWTTLKVLTWTKEFLAAKGVENARLEAEWLLCAATGLDRVGLYLQFEKPLDNVELAAYRAMVTRRARREPLQHILGSQEFYGLDFDVTPDVLIPRRDTEVLVSEAIARKPDACSLLDVGTGSGCIAVVLARQLPAAAVTATDISEAALAVARRNAERLAVGIEFLSGSLFVPLTGRRFDLIVSNPPYIPTSDIAALEPEVRDFDPHVALDGGIDGLNFYRSLIPMALEYLNPGGYLLVEVGIGQAIDVSRLFLEAGGYAQTFSALDPGGIERVVAAQRKENG
ncbi:MAG: peptide chain release factor N(5)-glutamine methyltransferase [Desulfuromonadaceae bacterium]|nr:peptide chain release factor N(5)-glutamine methyltransferase [Desulfuromonadaceae bacterium]